MAVNAVFNTAFTALYYWMEYFYSINSFNSRNLKFS